MSRVSKLSHPSVEPPRPRHRRASKPTAGKHPKAQRAIARGKAGRKARHDQRQDTETTALSRLGTVAGTSTRSQESDESDDAFDPRPRKVPDEVKATRRAESRATEDIRPPYEAVSNVLSTTIDADFEDQYVSQSVAVDGRYSSPSRPRGAIWVRSPKPVKREPVARSAPPHLPRRTTSLQGCATADKTLSEDTPVVSKSSRPSFQISRTTSFVAGSESNKPTTVADASRTAATPSEYPQPSENLKHILQTQPSRPRPPVADTVTNESSDIPHVPLDSQSLTHQARPFPANTMPDEFDDILDELADLPSDAFASSPPVAKSAPCISGAATKTVAHIARPAPAPTSIPPLGLADNSGKRQTTLWGAPAAPVTVPAASKSGPAIQPRKPSWRPSDKVDPPTHHDLDWEAAKTWLYPMNLGSIRDYQYNIVSIGLFHNALVALPTGLGKTFIAATIMLNWFRWTKSAQIVFLAPTKPLVAQQIDACSNIVGIPRSQTTMMTGEVPGHIRAEEWLSKRVFFMTPQTLDNDLENGRCDPKRLVLLVVDEAHRATGSYAYVEIVKRISQWNKSFRVLALTATPGDKVDKIQQVIDGLNIARCEIRTEHSIDIRQYIHSKETEIQEFGFSEEQVTIMDLLSTILKPLLSKLGTNGAFGMSDPLKMTAFGLKQTMDQFMKSEAGRNATHGLKGMMRAVSGTLTALATPLVLLKFFSITPFYNAMRVFRNEVESGTGDHGRSKYAKQIVEHANFTKMMNYMNAWTKNPHFVGHPKLEHLQGVVMNHFLDAQQGQPSDLQTSTRIMIFANYRDAAEDIVRVLSRNSPIIKPHVFVGQTGTARSEGMNQKKQLETIKKFKDGTVNVLVATSIGEEGLDIGEIDLIICYDASSSPIRMLQRMGRTGRKRRGKIVLLLMEEKEARDFARAKDNYESIQAMITDGTTFEYCTDQSPRILPKEITPVVNKCVVEVPPENSQATGLPAPKRSNKRPPKRQPKKFNMPDGVETGFVTASRVNGLADEDDDTDAQPRRKRKSIVKTNSTSISVRPTESVDWPTIDQVALNRVQEKELERKFQYVNNNAADHTIMAPQPERHPDAFVNLSETKYIRHGHMTKRVSRVMQNMRRINNTHIDEFRDTLVMSDVEILRDVDDPVVDDATLAPTQDDLAALDELMPAPRTKTPKPARQSDGDSKTVVGSTTEDDWLAIDTSMPPPRTKGKVISGPCAAKSPTTMRSHSRAESARPPVAVSPVIQRAPPADPPTPSILLSSTSAPHTAPRPVARHRSALYRVSSAMEADCSSSPETPADMRLRSQGIDLGLGDTSGEDEPDGEPDSELASFVVNSDAPIEMVSSSLPLAEDLTRPGRQNGRHGTRKKGLSQLFTDETEEIQSEPRQVERRGRLARKRPQKAIASSDNDEEDDVVLIAPPVAKRRAMRAKAVQDTDDEMTL